VFQGLPAIPIARIRVSEPTARTAGIALLRPLIESAAYVLRYPTLGVIVVLSIIPGAVGVAYQFMLPVVTRDLGAPAEAVGLLYAGGGAGGLLAGLVAEPLMQRGGHGGARLGGMGGV